MGSGTILSFELRFVISTLNIILFLGRRGKDSLDFRDVSFDVKDKKTIVFILSKFF